MGLEQLCRRRRQDKANNQSSEDRKRQSHRQRDGTTVKDLRDDRGQGTAEKRRH